MSKGMRRPSGWAKKMQHFLTRPEVEVAGVGEADDEDAEDVFVAEGGGVDAGEAAQQLAQAGGLVFGADAGGEQPVDGVLQGGDLLEDDGVFGAGEELIAAGVAGEGGEGVGGREVGGGRGIG